MMGFAGDRRMTKSKALAQDEFVAYPDGKQVSIFPGYALAIMALAMLAGCGSQGRLFPDVKTADVLGAQYGGPPQPTVRQPILPEMLVPRGKEPPASGAYLREERLSAPYRVLPPGARLSQEMSPTRLNIELDNNGRIIGLYCG